MFKVAQKMLPNHFHLKKKSKSFLGYCKFIEREIDTSKGQLGWLKTKFWNTTLSISYVYIFRLPAEHCCAIIDNFRYHEIKCWEQYGYYCPNYNSVIHSEFFIVFRYRSLNFPLGEILSVSWMNIWIFLNPDCCW